MKKELRPLTELTEGEFQKLIFKSIDSLNDQIGQLEGMKQEFQRLYRDYLIDKEYSHMRFYEDNGYLKYEKIDKSVGFHK